MKRQAAGRGRPLRFLVALGSGWVAVRAVMLWPVAALPAGGPPGLPGFPSFLPVSPAEASVVPWRTSPRPAPPRSDRQEAMPPHDTRVLPLPEAGQGARAGPAPLAPVESDPPVFVPPGLPRAVPPLAPSAPLPSRLSGSFWLVARQGGSGIAPGVVGGQLGGSQAGLRLAWLLDRRRRIALAARATTPLGPGQRELAAGVEWQPTRLPVRLVAEQRFAVAGGGRSGPALGVVAGLGPKRLGAGVTLEAYGQAGLIHRERTERYADGAVHVAHPLLDVGPTRVDIGAGAWGGAQRGAARLDLGPSVALTLPVAHRSIRLSLDWRERIAGQARPGSGLAITLGSDF